ncbi:MAG: DUF2935 domain-containing protein [Eubacteriales bacterium]
MNPIEEVYFWSGIMGDHGQFQLDAFSYKETKDINKARYFKDAFINIRRKAENSLRSHGRQLDEVAFINQVLPLVKNFIEFKTHLLEKLMNCDIGLNFTPTFLNHMINEAREFEKTLIRIKEKPKVNPIKENLHLHLAWLPDAIGHATAIIANLDYVEREWIIKAEEFKKDFSGLFIKTSELALIQDRIKEEDGALNLLNEEVQEKVEKFIVYLGKIRELREKCKLMGALHPLIPDHMMREEKYYLSSIQDLYT